MRKDVLVAIGLIIYFSFAVGLFFYAGAGWNGFIRGVIIGSIIGVFFALIVAEDYSSSLR